MTDLYSDELREYYFAAPSDEIALDTLELRHPLFVNEVGDVVAVRVVNDPKDLVATIEAGAPMNAAEEVTFQSCFFSVDLPEQSSPGLPTCEIAVENVARLLMPYLDVAAESGSPVEVTYRQYVVSDTGEPGLVMHGLTLQSVEANVLRVTATAGFEDFLNTPSPRTIYTTKEYPGLA